MTERAPTLANSFDMDVSPLVTELKFLYCGPGEDLTTGVVVASIALETPAAHRVAQMMLDQTDPVRIANLQMAAMKARAAAEAPHPANDEPPSAA